MGQIKRIFSKVLTHLLYGVSNILASDPISNRIRPRIFALSGVKLGKGVTMAPGTYVNPGKLTLGDNVFINQRCYFDLASNVVIGTNVKVGTGVSFITSQHEIGDSDMRCGKTLPKAIVVGDGAWIGTNAVILGGCVIGRGAVVAAGAVVNKDVPVDTLVGGVPARIIRSL